MFGARIGWVYQCRSCGETTLIDQTFLDLLLTKKIRGPGKCHLCDSKASEYEIVFEESLIMGKSERGGDGH